MTIYSRPITFTPAVAQPQTRYLPPNATLRQVRPPAAPAPTATTTTQPGGLSGSGGELTDETIAARAQAAVNRYPSAPFQNYTVQGGMWYGVSTVDGSTMYTRLNPATADTSPNPNYRYMNQGTGPATFSEGSAGNKVIAGSARPEAPGPGATKAQISAYSESLASWEREQMWKSIPDSATWTDISDWYGEARFDLPTQERRQWEIGQSLLPALPSQKFIQTEQQYAQQRQVIVSSSGNLVPTGREGYTYVDDSGLYLGRGERVADYRNVSTGALFSAPAVLNLGTRAVAAAPAAAAAGLNLVQMQLATMKSPFDITGRVDMGKATLPVAGETFLGGTKSYQDIAGKGVGLGISTDTMQQVRTTALALPGIRTLWSAGEYIGLDYLIGAKTAEYNKEFTALESQGLIVGGEFKGTDAQFTALEAKYKQIESLQNLQAKTLDRTLGVNVAQAQAGVAGTGWLYEGGSAITERGHEPWASFWEKGITNLGSLGVVAAIHTPFSPVPVATFAKGFGQGVAGVPAFLGMAVVGAEGLAKYPQAIPGAVVLGGYIQAKGVYEGLTTRPGEFIGEMYGTALGLHAAGRVAYAASPVKYTAGAFKAKGLPDATYRGLYAESPIRGLKNLVGGIEGLGARQLGGLTSYEGRPWYRPTASSGTPTHLLRYIKEGYPDFPALGVKIALAEQRLIRGGNLADLATFRQELKTMDLAFRIQPSTIKSPQQEMMRIPGMTDVAARDFLSTLRERFPTHRVGGSLAQSVQSRFSRGAADIDLYVPKEQIPLMKETVAAWNKRHGVNIGVDIHEYPQPGSYIERYGIRTEKDITVDGIHMMPIREQALRKLSQPMMLRQSEGAWRLLPEAHRGKDIADTTGALISEMQRMQESPVSFLHRGRIRALQESIDVQMGKMQPGSLPTETISGRFYDPSAAAASRFRQYVWDLTESPYVKIPGTRTYFDPTPYTGRVGAMYARFGVPAGLPGGVIFETGGKVRLHPEEVKMWEQMVVDESKGLVPPEDIRLFTKKGELMKDFKKRRAFGSVEPRLSREAKRSLSASTHTHPEMGVSEPAYYLKSEIRGELLLDKLRNLVGLGDSKFPIWRAASKNLYYKYELFVRGTDSPLHPGDAFMGIKSGERTQVVLTRDAVYVGRIKESPRSLLTDAYRDQKLFDRTYIRLLKETGGKLSDEQRAALAWETYRQVTLKSTREYYRGMGGMYRRIPIEEVTNFGSFSQEALSALETARKSTRTANDFAFRKDVRTNRFVRGLEIIDRTAFPEGTPTTNIRGVTEISIGEYPSTFKPVETGAYPAITSYIPAEKLAPRASSGWAAPYPATDKRPASGIDALISVGKYTTPVQVGRGPAYPSLTTDIGKYITPGKAPKYPPGIPPGKPPKYPPGIPPEKPPKYPPGIPPEKPPKYPPGVPPKTPPKYPPPWTPPPGTPPPGWPPGTPPPPGVPPSTPPPPKTPPGFPPTIPTRRITTILKEEETPKKKLRLHFDVRGSKWIIKNPIPRPEVVLGGETGKQYKNELKIYGKHYSKKTYTVHAPFDVITDYKVTKGLRF